MTFRQDEPTLAALLDAALDQSDRQSAPEAFDIARTSCRIPRAVLNEVRAVADANGMSMSLVINFLLDSYLTGQGRPGYAALAPWYADYALRTPETAKPTIQFDNTGE